VSKLASAMETAALRLVGDHPEIELDFTRESLEALEAMVVRAGKRVAEPTTRAWAAYLGETIRRQRPDAVTWVKRADAAGANAGVRGIDPGNDVELVLKVGADGYWFPFVKVEKFQRNGATDSLVMFAGVVLASLPRVDTEAERDRGRFQRADHGAQVIVAGQRFATKGEAADLRELDRLIFPLLGDPHEARNADVVRALGLRSELLAPLLEAAPKGRGYARIDDGHLAARWLATIAIVGVEPRADVEARLRPGLASKHKSARENAAFALAYIDGRGGSTREIVAQASSGDGARFAGALRAVYSLANDWRMNEYAANLAFAPLVDMFEAALDPKSACLGTALDALWTWVWHSKSAGDIAPVVPALIALDNHPKPQTRRSATDIVGKYLWAIANGHAVRDANNERLAKRAGVGKEQLAQLAANQRRR